MRITVVVGSREIHAHHRALEALERRSLPGWQAREEPSPVS
jgi:hypothetical protein